jgi:hypothetical protein
VEAATPGVLVVHGLAPGVSASDPSISELSVSDLLAVDGWVAAIVVTYAN